MASYAVPSEFTDTIAPTMMPFGSTTLAVPMPPLTPPETAPVPAPTLPSATGPLFAATHACTPDVKSGREAGGALQVARSNEVAVGAIGTTAGTPLMVPTGKPMPALSRQLITPLVAAIPNALPPLSTIAFMISTMLSGRMRSVSRVSPEPPR